MENSFSLADSNFIQSSGAVTLLMGSSTEIGNALEKLGAKPATIAQAMISFSFAKIPGALVCRVDGGFKIGKSFLTEAPTKAIVELGHVHKKFTGVMVVNDNSYALAA